MVSRRKKILSFGITALGLLALFLIAVNTGSLKVTPLELFKGLFVEYNESVATIYDLRFPRILIAIFGGAATAVSGVLLQAVMKNHGGTHYRVCPHAVLFYAPVCFSRRHDRFSSGVQPFLERRAQPPADHSGGRSGQRHVYGVNERL